MHLVSMRRRSSQPTRTVVGRSSQRNSGMPAGRRNGRLSDYIGAVPCVFNVKGIWTLRGLWNFGGPASYR